MSQGNHRSSHVATRILCLGNELLADDALGHAVATEVRRRSPELDVVFASTSGFQLLDYMTDADRIVIVDSIQTGQVPPGTLYVLRNSDIQSPSGPSPHYVGVFEALQLARELLLNVPQDVTILAVEAADCLTLGGEMHRAVKSAVEMVADLVTEIAAPAQADVSGQIPDSGDGLGRAIATVSDRWGSDRLVVS